MTFLICAYPLCEKEFEPYSHNHKYCCSKCRKKNTKLNYDKTYRKINNSKLGGRGFIYILGCWNNENDKAYYVGETTDIPGRLSTHCTNFQTDYNFTANYKNKVLLYIEIVEPSNKSRRLQREKEIIDMNNNQKEELIVNMPKNIEKIVKVVNFLLPSKYLIK